MLEYAFTVLATAFLFVVGCHLTVRTVDYWVPALGIALIIGGVVVLGAAVGFTIFGLVDYLWLH